MPQLQKGPPNGLEAARQILRHNPRQRILVLTVTESEKMAQELLRVRAKGYVLQSDAATDLVRVVEALQLDRTFFNSGRADGFGGLSQWGWTVIEQGL